MIDRENLIDMMQVAVDGCARNFAEVIADNLIANGVTVQRWIPVSDMLPRFMQIVLVTDGKYVYKAALNTKNKWIGDYINSMTFKATHWMQLPQPPKGE